MTELDKKIIILGDLYSKYNDDEDMGDFFEYNDLGLPMAYMISEELVSIADKGMLYIEETWNLFLEALEIEDMGFDNLEQVLKFAENKAE